MKRMLLVAMLVIGALSAQRAMAESDMGFKAIGASVAYVDPENVGGTLGLGIFADLGRITPRIGLEPHLEFWSHSESAFGAEASIRDIALGARGKYYFPVANSSLRPFAGAGLGLHFLKAETTVSIPGYATMTGEASDTKLGLDLGGGLETPLSPKIDFSAAAWYGFVSDVNQFALRLGISHKLGH